MSGGPTLLPWSTNNVPQIDQQDSQINLGVNASDLSEPGILGPSLVGQIPSPPSTPGQDPGMIHAPRNFRRPPVAVVGINSQGGMPGDQAPQQRWGGQQTHDYGNFKTSGSQLTDFGQKLTDKPNLAMWPQESQDGPRQAVYPGQLGWSSNRAPNMRGAQDTTDLGHRIFFKGANLRARSTIAPY